MPHDSYGQLITFAAVYDPDLNAPKYVYVRAQKNDTIFRIAGRRGAPQLVPQILALNSDLKIRNGHKLRSATQVLKTGSLVRLPGTLAPGESFSVLCGAQRPKIMAGYAKYDTVERPGRVGINRFLGYDPIQLDIAVQWEGFTEQARIEIDQDILVLERMAGRGKYDGAAQGPPAVVQVSVTDNKHSVVPLVPFNYQWSSKNPTAPLYRISNITWEDNALSGPDGRRIRQSATISVKQYTPVTNIKRSATQRAKSKGK